MRFVSCMPYYVLNDRQVVEQYKRRTSFRTCKVGEDLVKVRTVWFESFGDHPIRAPPDRRALPRLQLGDIFYHRLQTSPDYQMWLWSGNVGTERWIDVHWGYRRDDGVYMTLTPNEQKPSWVGEQRFLQREREGELPIELSCSFQLNPTQWLRCEVRKSRATFEEIVPPS